MHQPALWPASGSPATVIVDAESAGCDEMAPLDIDGWPRILADRMLSDGRHLVLGDIDGPHHVWLRGTLDNRPIAYVIVRDAAIETRRQAAWRLDRRLGGAPPSRRIGAFQPTIFQRRRLLLLLDILDLLQSATGTATSYDVAQALIYPDLKVGRGMDWKCSAERRRTMRLIDQGRRLMNGGYRDLLRGVVRG